MLPKISKVKLNYHGLGKWVGYVYHDDNFNYTVRKTYHHGKKQMVYRVTYHPTGFTLYDIPHEVIVYMFDCIVF